MTTIFVSHAKEDTVCAETIRQGLEAQGYAAWREPDYPGPSEYSYAQMIENAILGSAVVVLVWSSNAAQFAWVKRHILFAQRLQKQIIPVVLDSTSLPNTLIMPHTLTAQAPCGAVVAQLLPHLPAADSTEPLLILSAKAAHEYIRHRKEAIEQADELLKRNEHREEVLAILTYLAHNDLMMGVRDKAQEVLDAATKKDNAPSPPPGDSRYIFGVRCEHGHVSYFDKRRVCVEKKQIVRAAGTELDELELPCATCGVAMTVHVDCEV